MLSIINSFLRVAQCQDHSKESSTGKHPNPPISMKVNETLIGLWIQLSRNDSEYYKNKPFRVHSFNDNGTVNRYAYPFYYQYEANIFCPSLNHDCNWIEAPHYDYPRLKLVNQFYKFMKLFPFYDSASRDQTSNSYKTVDLKGSLTFVISKNPEYWVARQCPLRIDEKGIGHSLNDETINPNFSTGPFKDDDEWTK